MNMTVNNHHESTVSPLLLSVEQAMETLGGIGRTTFYALVNSGDIELVKLGRRTFVTRKELERFVGTL